MTYPRRNRKQLRITRDMVIFTVGLGGIINEAFVRDGEPREVLLLLFATMIGLPAFLRKDEALDAINAKELPPVQGKETR